MRSKIAAVIAASSQGKRPLLVHIEAVERITPEARQLLIDETCSTRTAVVGADDVGRVMAAFTRSATPSRYFTQESDAIAWLLEASIPYNVSGLNRAVPGSDVSDGLQHPLLGEGFPAQVKRPQLRV